jgi:hypothetical protein
MEENMASNETSGLETIPYVSRKGSPPRSMRHATIVTLKKPGKDNYTVAEAWRPISLLSTLGMILEAMIAERISCATEEFRLLPANRFGARKGRAAE